MAWKDDYTEERSYDDLIRGEYMAEIRTIKETTTKSDKRMFDITLLVGDKTLFYHIVEGPYFNRHMTRFFHCFGIRPGNFDYTSWLQKKGRVFIDKKQDSSFFEVKYLVLNKDNGA